MRKELKNIINYLMKSIMKTEQENEIFEDNETAELDIESLTEIQGGIEDDEKRSRDNCGLGCYIGSGSGKPDEPIQK